MYPPAEGKDIVIDLGILWVWCRLPSWGSHLLSEVFSHFREKLERYQRSEDLHLHCEALDFCGLDIQESENIASLHNQITACDAVLEVSNLGL